jgi:hypothetical protein
MDMVGIVEVISMSVKYTIYDFMIESLPNTDGFGNTNKTVDEAGIPNHSAFQQTIREDHEGDVGVFIINSKDNTEMKFIKLTESEIQIVVNCIHGDIEQTIEYLENLFNRLKESKGNNYIDVFSCRKINLRPVGKNSKGIHWCVLNMLIKYRYK